MILEEQRGVLEAIRDRTLAGQDNTYVLMDARVIAPYAIWYLSQNYHLKDVTPAKTMFMTGVVPSLQKEEQIKARAYFLNDEALFLTFRAIEGIVDLYVHDLDKVSGENALGRKLADGNLENISGELLPLMLAVTKGEIWKNPASEICQQGLRAVFQDDREFFVSKYRDKVCPFALQAFHIFAITPVRHDDGSVTLAETQEKGGLFGFIYREINEAYPSDRYGSRFSGGAPKCPFKHHPQG